MPAEEHGDAGQRAAHITDRIARVAEAQDVTFPFWVLLGEIDEFEGHGSPPLAVERNDVIIPLDERGKIHAVLASVLLYKAHG